MPSILENPTLREAVLPISVDQYHRLGEAGIIAENTELLRGVILEKIVKLPRHTWLVQSLFETLGQSLGGMFHVRQEQPLTLADSEPEPDIAVVQGVPDDYQSEHPTTATLVIEVATSSVEIDRQKAVVYAAAGVDEYWILDDAARVVDIYREPTSKGYRQHDQHPGASVICSLGIAGIKLDIGLLINGA